MHLLSKATSQDPGVRMLRVSVGALLLIHGLYRFFAGGVAPFGEFLDSVGLPFGFAIAATLTFVEIIGAPLLAAGVAMRALIVWFAIELTIGIVLVHARDGWFVVGGGRNGVEYSVLLLLALASLFVSDAWWRRRAV